jgi:uncharacterized membrane protein YfcA
VIPDLDQAQWALALLAVFSAGLSKAGFTGIGLVAVIVFASIFGARDSTGVVLPLFIAADFGAVGIFRQHARWDYIRRTLPPAAAGVIAGTLIMQRMDNASFRPVLGSVILALTVVQLTRLRWPDLFGRVPHSRGVALGLGFLAGMTTMMANAAGPLVALYFVAVGLPKFEIVGTLAWFFFIINLFKVPFSAGIGVIHGSSLLLDAILVPAVFAGLFAGRWLIHRVPQRAFDALMLTFAGVAALRLLVS